MLNVSDVFQQFYRNFFGKNPDNTMLASYVQKIENGQMNFNSLILEFYNSNDFRPHFEQVYRLHKAALLREPVYDGIQTVLNEMRKPTFNIFNLADIYVSSQEFKNKYGDLNNYDQLIENFYLNILGRPSDPQGKAGWVNALKSGQWSIGQVLVSFSESAENIAKQDASLNAYWTTAFINNSDPNLSSNPQVRQQYLDMKNLFSLTQFSKQQLINTAIQDNLERFNADNPSLFIPSKYFIDTIEDSISATLQNIIDSTPSSKDTYSPKIVSSIPIDNSKGNPTDGYLAIVFSDNMALGTGYFYIKRSMDNSIVEKIDIRSNQVFLKDNYIIIDPSVTLKMNTDYYINIDPTALKTTEGHFFAGISDTTTLNFTVSPQSGTGAGGGTDKNDTINGTSGDDYIDGYLGDDVIYGYEGNDSLYGGIGNDKLFGGSGNDYLSGDDGNDTLDGGEGNDTIMGGGGDDTILVSSGTDVIDGGDGNDTYLGTSANDKIDLLYIKNIELVNGAEGDDRFINFNANISDVVIDGGAGNDTIYGSFGSDTFNLANFKNIEYIYGDAGNDIFNLDINGTNTIKYIDGGPGIDRLNGTPGNDTIKLDAPPNTIISIEIIDGGAGDDVIEGSPNAETIIGGHGADILVGWGGADTFYFRKGDSNYADYRTDTIKNFVTNEDKISFEGGKEGSSVRDGALPAFTLIWTDKNSNGKFDPGEESYQYQILQNGNYAEIQIDSGAVSWDDRADAFTLAASIMQGDATWGGVGKDCDYVLVGVDKSGTIGVFQQEFWLFWDWNDDNVPDMAIKLDGLQWLYQFDGNDIIAGLGL